MPTMNCDDRAGVSIWKRVTQFPRQPSLTAARALLNLQFSDRDLARMRMLARKSRAGTLAAEEQIEAETYEQMASLLGIVHSQARRTLKRSKAAS